MSDAVSTHVVALSREQRDIWVADASSPNPTSHVIAALLHVEGPLDSDALEHALRRLIHRHRVLRTRVDVMGSELIGVVDEATEFTLATCELDGADRDTLVARAGSLVSVGFDLAASLPIRAWLVRGSADVAVLAMAIHHIAFDGGSFPIFYRDLSAFYRDEIGRGTAGPDALVREYHELPTATIAAGERQRQLEWWRSVLVGRPRSEIVADHERPARRRGDGAVLTRSLPADLAQRLDSVARTRGSSRHIIVATAVLLLVGERSGHDNVCVGTTYGTRTTSEMRTVIGPYVNLTAIPYEIDRGNSLSETLDGVADRMSEVLSARDVPFGDVCAAADVKHDASRTPVFAVMVDVTAPAGTPDLADCRVRALRTPCLGSKFDLTVSVEFDLEVPTVSLYYDPALFEPGSIDALSERCAELFAAVADLSLQQVGSEIDRAG